MGSHSSPSQHSRCFPKTLGIYQGFPGLCTPQGARLVLLPAAPAEPDTLSAGGLETREGCWRYGVLLHAVLGARDSGKGDICQWRRRNPASSEKAHRCGQLYGKSRQAGDRVPGGK